MAARVLGMVISWLALSIVPTVPDNPLSMITNRIPKLKLQVDRVENCRDIPLSVIQLDGLTLTPTGFNRFSANGKVKMSRTVDKPLSISIEMHKCSSKDDANSCEFFLSMRKSKICNTLLNPNSGWQEFTKNSNLPKTCPFAADARVPRLPESVKKCQEARYEAAKACACKSGAKCECVEGSCACK